MNEFLDTIAKIAVLAFVATSMVAVGLELRLRDLLAAMRRRRLVLFALVANFVISPLLAYTLTEVIPLQPAYAIGLLLLGGAAGAPFLPKLAQVAQGDFAYSVGLMLLLTVGSVIFMPILLPLLLPGLAANPWSIARPLLITMMLPLAVAMAVKQRSERWAVRLLPAFKIAASVSLLTTVALLLGLNWTGMIGTFGSGAALTAMLFVSLCLITGYALGGPSSSTRSVLALGTGQRNIAAGLVIATQNFTDPTVTVMLLVATFSGLMVLLIAARAFARRASKSVIARADDTATSEFNTSPSDAISAEVTR